MPNLKSDKTYKTKQTVHKTAVYKKSGILKEILKITLKTRHNENAVQNGINIFCINLSFIWLTFTRRFTFKKAVKKFEKYIIPKKAYIP